jgi:hypothetical protein
VQDEAIHGETVLPGAGRDLPTARCRRENSPVHSAPQAIVGTVSDERQLFDRNLGAEFVRMSGDRQLLKLREFSAIEFG